MKVEAQIVIELEEIGKASIELYEECIYIERGYNHGGLGKLFNSHIRDDMW